MASKRCKSMMTEIDQLDVDDLEVLSNHIADKMKEKQRAKMDALRQQFAEIAAKNNVSVDEVLGKARERSKAPPKYRNPADPRETWSGQGRKPDWYKDHLANGGKESEMLIRSATTAAIVEANA